MGALAGCPEGCPDPLWPPLHGGEGVDGSSYHPTLPQISSGLNGDGISAACDAAGAGGDVQCLAWVPCLGVQGVTWGWEETLMQRVVALDTSLASLPQGWAGKGLEEPVGSSLGCAKPS